MTDTSTNTGKELMSSTELAYQRTLIAEERTLMAWIRTAISLISFGFTIYKFFNDRENAAPEGRLLTARQVGMIMIILGLLGLLLAQIDHYRATRRILADYPGQRRSVAGIMAVLIWIFGLSLFLAALYRQ